MKIGVISDIHSNLPAFRACMVYLEEAGCDEYLFLGDYVSDTPYTEEVMELLYSVIDTHTCTLLRGNREEYILGQFHMNRGEADEPRWVKNSASGNLLYTYERLSERDLQFFESLPISFVYKKEGYPAITCAHGSPDNSRELLQLDKEPVQRWLDRIDTDYLLCAHTHLPGMLEFHNKTYINSGCCGIAISDHGYAQCVILNAKAGSGEVKWIPKFLKIPYNSDAVIEEMFSSGLYDYGHWFINANIHILKTGIDRAAELISLALKYAQKDMDEKHSGTKVIWPYIDDKYFELAAAELSIPEYGKKIDCF